MSNPEIAKIYNPKEVETRLYTWWEESGFFKGNVNKDKKPYTIVIPPPNVTGSLHIGHVLNNTLQDVLIRWKRMLGYEALWIPGVDHAGIATQNVVERALAKQHIDKHELGREKFVERVWEWKNQYGSTIVKQLRKLGVSCDWSRERFTMDEGLSKAVKEVFIRLFDKGLVYRGKYLVNWCPQHRTALSDDEVEHTEQEGSLWHIRYPIDGVKESAIVATTRPETMLGDTAVAVHPDDERYKHLIGKFAVLPLAGRKIPIIADEFVDMAFGTGMVKVTPAHDPNDYQMAQRHPIEVLNIFDDYANMNGSVPRKYQGLERFECRKRVVADLEAHGFLQKVDKHINNVGTCYRCHTIIEPYLSEQWFVSMKSMAEPAHAAVKEGYIKFYPERWTKVYEHWMTGIRDWCISRQLWWGHRIPVYYTIDGRYTAAHNHAEARKKLGLSENAFVRQDEDVLDTWFSSWLWPFSVLDWPEDNENLRYFNPTDTLVTAPDIIFFWVARMIMANMEFMKGYPNREGQPRTTMQDLVPFNAVYFTSTVRDMQGRKMSKSLGNSPDPLDIIDEFGADALRFTMVYTSPVGQDVLFSLEKCEIGRNFANKLWNAGRFLQMNRNEIGGELPKELPAEHCDLADEWILSRFEHISKDVSKALDGFNFTEAAHDLYHFIWHDFCDWYIEFAKTRFFSDEPIEMKRTVIARAFWLYDRTLRLLHPFMPYITEELWQNLSPRNGETIMRSAYPSADNRWQNDIVEQEMTFIQDVINALRNIRGENNIAPSKEIGILLLSENSETITTITKYEKYLKKLCRANRVQRITPLEKPTLIASAVVEGVELLIPLEGLIDFDAERTRLAKEIARIEGMLKGIEAKLSNVNFAGRAPADVIEREKEKRATFSTTLEKLRQNLSALKR